LADGIDTVAHKACLEVNGKTIAVLGGGILNIYPTSNIALAEEIVSRGGLLVSEYKPAEPSLTYHFPVRNRIIAGLSKAVFIVEATEKSGSMHTKNYALEFNREVFALPARVGDVYSIGCNKCIKNGQACMVLGSEDITSFYGHTKYEYVQPNAIQLNYEEQLIYDFVKAEEKHFDEIMKETKMDTKNLLTMLMRLELKGIISKLPGNYYKVNN
jgi:DNA processing protein